jgi:tetratricopeptide (TPR) repeat protein
MMGCTAADHALISKAYFDQGKYEDAIKNAKQGISINPNHAPSA